MFLFVYSTVPLILRVIKNFQALKRRYSTQEHSHKELEARLHRTEQQKNQLDTERNLLKPIIKSLQEQKQQQMRCYDLSIYLSYIYLSILYLRLFIHLSNRFISVYLSTHSFIYPLIHLLFYASIY